MSRGQRSGDNDRSNMSSDNQERMGGENRSMAQRGDDDDFLRPFGFGFRSQIFRDIDRWTDRLFRSFDDLERQAEQENFLPTRCTTGIP